MCAVKPYVLRYWEQEFTQLKPVKRRGNRRYYQHHEVLLIRRIRNLLYEQGFTISGARNKLADGGAALHDPDPGLVELDADELGGAAPAAMPPVNQATLTVRLADDGALSHHNGSHRKASGEARPDRRTGTAART